MNTQQLHTAINEAFTDFKSIQTSRRHRMDFAESLTEDYFAEHGKMPDGTILDRLATLILQDELADKHPDKMTREEYPLLSEDQSDRRNDKEYKVSEMHYGNDATVGFRKVIYEDETGATQIRRKRMYDFPK